MLINYFRIQGELGDIFEEIDTSGNGIVDREEFFESLKENGGNKQFKKKLFDLDISTEEMEELWEILDNGDGELTMEEFVTGLRKMTVEEN